MLRFSDARNFGRTLTGICLIAGALVLLIQSIVAPSTDHKNKTHELSAIASHKSSYIVSALLLFAAGVLLVPAAIGLIRAFRGPRGVTLGQVAGLMLVYASAVLLVFYAFSSIR